MSEKKMILFNKSLITLLFLSLLCLTIEAQQQSYLYHSCDNTTTFPRNSTYQENLNQLLSSLSSNATRGNQFYNVTSGRNTNVVYGLFLCRGDVSNSTCEDCVSTATNGVAQRCPIEKVAVIWYEFCLVRYSDNSMIFSTMNNAPTIFLWNTGNTTDRERFDQILGVTMGDAATLALNATFGIQNFATREATVSGFQTLYNLVQCTPDLSRADCDTCLREAIANLPSCCGGRQGGRVLTPSCNIRYEVYPFYNQTAVVSFPPPPPVITPPLPPPPVAPAGSIITSVLYIYILLRN